MEIAFFKAIYGGLKGKIVSKWTGQGEYSHCELVFSDGLCFSTDKQDGYGGKTRWKTIDFDTKWDIIPLSIKDEQEATLRAWCNTQEGMDYDHLSTVGYTFFRRWSSVDKWYCSNLAGHALREIGIYAPVLCHPTELYKWLNIVKRAGNEDNL
jgi:hypothetical protein